MMLLSTLVITGSHFLKKYKMKIMNEALLATIMGFCAGFLLKLFNEENLILNISGFYVKFFLIVLLPPIIFEA